LDFQIRICGYAFEIKIDVFNIGTNLTCVGLGLRALSFHFTNPFHAVTRIVSRGKDGSLLLQVKIVFLLPGIVLSFLLFDNKKI
jgi:hypothetical protein